MQILNDSHPILRRYLTLFYGFTLGLALILAVIAAFQQRNSVPDTPLVTQEGLSQTASPTRDSTQEQRNHTPTSLPAIPPTPNEKTPSPLGVTMTALNGLQVSLWHPWTGSTGETLQAILEEFSRTNRWGITIRPSAYEGFGRLDEAVEVALSSDSLPDVLVDYGYQARHWDGNDTLVNLTPYVEDPIWGLTGEQQADFYPAFWAEDLVFTDSSDQTMRLGIPFYRSAYALFYNLSWGRQLGYPDPPATLEEFRERACAAAVNITEQSDKSNLGKGGWLITPQPGILVGWIYAFGGNIINPTGSGYLFNTPETRQALAYLKGLQTSGCAWYETGLEPASEFANRRALFIIGSLFDISAQQQVLDQAGSADEWLVIPFPSGSQPVVTYGPSLAVTRSIPAQQLAAWLVIEWLVYPPNQARWVAALEAYPTRQSTLDYLSEAAGARTQWAQALELLPDARSEPSLASWSVMRWVLEDATAQLFDPQTSADQIPSLLENLDSLAAEILTQVR